MPLLPEDTINPLTGKPVGQKASLKDTAVIGQEDINPLTGLTVGEKGPLKYNSSIGDFARPASAAHQFSFTAGDDLYDFTKYGVDVNVLTDYTKARAVAQPGWEQTLAFLNQAIIGELGGGLIESVGYLLDMAMMGDLIAGTEEEFGNIMSRTGKGIKEWTKEVTPAYEERPGTFDMSDPGWWASNGPSVFSTISLMLPAMGFTKLAGMAARGIGLARAAKKGTGVYQKAVGLKPLTVAQEAKIGWVGGAVSQAVMSRHAESLMESSQIFDQNYKRYRDEGLDDKAARELAGKGAAKVYKENWWMLLTDLPQYLMLGARFTPGGGKIARAVNKAAEKGIVKVPNTGLNIGARFTLGMVSEGFEEGYQHVIGEEGTYVSDLQGGFTDESAFRDRLDQYLNDGRLWTSVFYGAFGGGIFQAAMPKVQDFINKKQGIPTQEDVISEKIKVINEMMPALSAATKRVKEADQSGIVGMMYEARTNLNLYKALQHIATGTFDQHIAFLDHLENMSEEEIAEWNEAHPDVQFDKAIIDELMPELREASHEINKIYQEESKRQKPEIAIRTTEELYKISKFKKDAAKYELAVSELEEQYLQKEKLSPIGQELYDVKLQKAAYLQAKKQIQYLLKNDTVAPDARDIYNERMDDFAAAVMILDKQEKELESRERTAAEKKEDARVFKTMKNLDPLNEKRAQLDMLNLAIDTANQRLKRLKDPRTSATGDQRIAERAWTTTQVEEKLRAHSPESLMKARAGQRIGVGNDVTMKIAGKTISGVVTYPVKKADIEAARMHLGLGIEKETAKKMKPVPLGYLFISHDNKIIRIIHGDNIDSLTILDRESQIAEGLRQEQAEILAKRRESLIKVHDALKTNIEGLQNKIKENKDKIEFSLLEIEELASDLQVIERTTPGRKKIDGKTPQQWKAEYREKVEFSIMLIEETIEDLQKLNEDIREKRDVLQGELNTLLNYHKEVNLEGAQNAETAIRKENLHSPYSPLALTEIKKLLETADYHVVETEKEIQRLSTLLEDIKEFYDPVEAADLVITRKTYTKWFEEKYPNNPGSRGYMEQILKSFKPPWSIYKKYIEAHPEYIDDLKRLEKIKARIQGHKEIRNNMLATYKALNMARRALRIQRQEADMLRSSRNNWMHSQDILSLYKKVGKEYLNIIKEDKQAVIDAETLTANQTASGNLQSPPINPPLKNLAPFLTEAEFAKESLNTTSGFHIDKGSGEVTKRIQEARWYAALAKMPVITDEDEYHLQIVNLKYAKENDLEEAYDREDVENDNTTSLKAILVDSNGTPIRATDEGELDPKGNILSTYIHLPNFVDELSKKRIVRKYMVEVLGADVSEIKEIIKSGDTSIGKDTYTFEEIVSNARVHYSKKQENFREKAIAELEKGNSVFVAVLEKSAGIERNLPEVDGKRQRNNLDTFAKLDEIVAFHIPTSDMMTLNTNSHVHREVYPGMVYVENERGNTTGALNRLLDEKEVDMIASMISYAANTGNEVHRVLTTAEKKKKGKAALKTTYYLFPKKNVASSDFILPNLVYYGKINEEGIRKSLEKEGATEAQIKNEIARRQKHQLYINYQTKMVSYGYEEKSQIPNSVSFNNIKTDPQFREWLLGKYHQINRLNLTQNEKGKNNVYLHPLKFNEDTGGVTMQFYNHSKNMAGYETFLHSLLKTDIVPATEVQFASTYFTYSYKIFNELAGEVVVKTEEEEEVKPEEEVIVETEPTIITNTNDLVKIKEGYTFDIRMHLQGPSKEDASLLKTFNLRYEGTFKDNKFVLEKFTQDLEEKPERIEKNQQYLNTMIIAEIKKAHTAAKGKGVGLTKFFTGLNISSFVITPPIVEEVKPDIETETAPAEGNVIIDIVKGKTPQPGAVVAFRTEGKTEKNMITALKDNAVGNPFGPYAAIKEKDDGTAVTRFLNWLEGTGDTNIMQEYRKALLAKVPELKGKTIYYYKDLGRPSHATALDYFLNKAEEPLTITITEAISEEETKTIILDEDPKLASAIYKELGLQGEQGEIKLADIKNIDFSSVNPEIAKLLQEKLQTKFPKIKLEFTDLPIPESTDPDVQNQRVGNIWIGSFEEQTELRKQLLGPTLRANTAAVILSKKDEILINSTAHILISNNPLKYFRVNKNNTISIELVALSSDIIKELGNKIIPQEIIDESFEYAKELDNKEAHIEKYNARLEELKAEQKRDGLLVNDILDQISSSNRFGSPTFLFDLLVNTNSSYLGNIPVNTVPFALEGIAGNVYNYTFKDGNLIRIYKVDRKKIKAGGKFSNTMSEIINTIIDKEENEDLWLDAQVVLERFKRDNKRVEKAIHKLHIEKILNRYNRTALLLDNPSFKDEFLQQEVEQRWEDAASLGPHPQEIIDVQFEHILSDNLRANNIINDDRQLTAPFGITTNKFLKITNNEEYKTLKEKKRKIEYILDNQDKFNNDYEKYEASLEEGDLLAPVPGWFVNAYSVSMGGRYLEEITGMWADFRKGLIYTGAQIAYDALHDKNILPEFQKIADTTDLNSLLTKGIVYGKTYNLSNDLVILNQKEQGKIVGQANFEAMSVLIHNAHQRQDTLPHEYAHHYVRWFKDSAIVQEGIKRFGSEENLVQKIGEQATLQKGEAWNIWEKLVNWILEQLSDKQLLQVLTDSFLEAVNLNEQFTYGAPNAAQKKEAQNIYNDYRSTTTVKAGSKKDTKGFKEFVGQSKVSSSESVGFEGLGTGMTSSDTESINKMNEDGENESAGNNNSTKECK